MNRLNIIHLMVISKYYSSIHSQGWKEGSSISVHIKFKVHGSSIMEFPDWVQVKVKTLYQETTTSLQISS